MGYALQLPAEERFLNSKEELKGQIATLLGGRSAEEVVFGKITTGASNDLQRATDILNKWLELWDGEILGPLAYDKQGGGQFLVMATIREDQSVMQLLKLLMLGI